MSVEQMRNAMRRLYGPSWVRRVDNMKDNQVVATYQRLLNAGKFKEKK